MIRVASYQARAKTTFSQRKQHILKVLTEADQKQIDFLCFPEGFLTGYYADKEEAMENSLDILSQDFQEWLFQTTPFKTTVIIGFNERKEEEIFDSAAIIEGGLLLGIQRKHYLYHTYFSSSSFFSLFQSKGIAFGVAICRDTNYFEPSRLLALQGASLLFSPMCNKVPLDHPFVKRPSYYSHLVARSHENRCWLISADWIWPNDGKSYCPGHTVIYDPDGLERMRSEELKEQFLIVDISQERLFHEKGQRVHGSYLLFQEIERRKSLSTGR